MVDLPLDFQYGRNEQLTVRMLWVIEDLVGKTAFDNLTLAHHH